MIDDSKLQALKRRIEQDPGSIAFAQLAEEYRRAGQFQEAVDCSRAGLKVHPGYVSARLTLGRALLQLGDLESAQRELETVLTQAPENLAAMRGVAEIHRRRGNLVQSLERYRAALELAKDDSELEQVLTELTREVAAQVDTSRSESLPPPESETLPVPPVETAERALEPTIDDRKLMLALRTMGALEEWLAACHVARAQRRAE